MKPPNESKIETGSSTAVTFHEIVTEMVLHDLDKGMQHALLNHHSFDVSLSEELA